MKKLINLCMVTSYLVFTFLICDTSLAQPVTILADTLDTPEKVLDFAMQRHASASLTRLLLARFDLPPEFNEDELVEPWFRNNFLAATVTNVRINNFSGDVYCPSGQDETTISVSGNRILAGWNDSEGFRSSPYRVCGYGLSVDGGGSFVDRGQQPAPGGFDNLSNGGDPDVAFYNDTIAYFSYIAYRASVYFPNYVGVNKSVDGGQMFSFTGKVRGPAAASGGFTDKCFMAVDRSGSIYDGYVYVSWTDMGTGSTIMVARSTDGGSTFDTPISLDSGSVQGSYPLVAANGDVYVSWWDGGNKVRKSSDGGATFLPERVIAASAPGPGNSSGWLDNTRIRSNPYPLMIADQTDPAKVYATWAANPAGSDDADVYFSKTEDSGNTWSAPIRVNGDTTTTDQFFPSVGVDNAGNIAVVYYDRRNDSANTWIDVMVSLSTDGGLTFPYEQTINDVSFRALGDTSSGYAIGDYNHTEAQGGIFHTVWGDGRRTCSGEPDNDVYYAQFTAEDITGIDVPVTKTWTWIMLLIAGPVFLLIIQRFLNVSR